MMNEQSSDYLVKVELCILDGVSIDSLAMTTEQYLRTLVVYEVFQIWLDNKQINVHALMHKIRSREYSVLLQKANEGNPDALEYVRALNIQPNQPYVAETIVDISVFNHLVSRFCQRTENIELEKAKVVDAANWLIQHGKATGNERFVKNGEAIKRKLN